MTYIYSQYSSSIVAVAGTDILQLLLTVDMSSKQQTLDDTITLSYIMELSSVLINTKAEKSKMKLKLKSYWITKSKTEKKPLKTKTKLKLKTFPKLKTKRKLN